MKKLKKVLSLFLALCMVFSMLSVSAFAAEEESAAPSTKEEWETWIKGQMGDNKFMAILASKLNDGSFDAVIGTVDSGYNATLTLPNGANGNSAVIGVGMQNVGSLGVDEARAHAMILRDENGQGTELTGESLSNLMSDLYSFKGATVNATIIGTDGAKHPVTYMISAASKENGSKTTITATPSGDVSAAWHAMVNKTNFDVTNNNSDDSSITIANGSWLQIGNQLLQFEGNYGQDLKLDNIANFTDLNAEIRKAVELVEQDSTSVSFHLAAGTTLAVSSSAAGLNKPVTVNMTGVELDGSILTDLRDGNVNGLTALFGMMNDVLAKAQSANVNVTIQFGEVTEPDEPDEPKTTEEQVRENIADLLEDNKFVAVIASKLNNGSIAQLLGTVDSSYKATLKLPKTANAGNVTIGVGMNNVGSMGINSPKIHTMYVETSWSAETEMAGLMSTLYEFKGTTINANIKKGETAANVTYTVSAVQDNTITATPGEGVSDAWHLMVNKDNFEFQTDKTPDSYIVIANGSWLKIGNDLLVFENDGVEDLKLDNITMENLGELNETIRAAVKLIEAQADQTAPVMFKLAKGTELAVSSSSAKLTEDVTVSVDNVTLPNNVANILETLKDAQSADAKDAIMAMMGLMDGMLNAVQDKTVSVTIEFTCEHDYGEPTWTWNGTSSATAAFTCTKCGDVKTETATGTNITSAVTTPAQVGVAGERTYTATVKFGEKDYIDTKTESIPALPSGGTTPTPPPVDIEDPDTPLVEKPFLFADVTEKNWFYADVKKAFDLGLMVGTDDQTFSPFMSSTRGMVALVLYRMEGEPSVKDAQQQFTDLDSSSWYYNAALWAAANGVYNGYEDGSFRGEKEITREELVAVLMRYAALKGYDTSKVNDLSAYVDKDAVGGWALNSMQWAVGTGLVNGRGAQQLVPQGMTNRAELATVLVRFVNTFMPDLANQTVV